MQYPPEKLGADLRLALSQMIHRPTDVSGADSAARGAVVGQDVDLVRAEPSLSAGNTILPRLAPG